MHNSPFHIGEWRGHPPGERLTRVLEQHDKISIRATPIALATVFPDACYWSVRKLGSVQFNFSGTTETVQGAKQMATRRLKFIRSSVEADFISEAESEGL